MNLTFILSVSVLLQFTAAFLALRLIRITGKRRAWLFIAAGISLMAIRRSITLFRLLSGGSYPVDPAAELVALATSVLMVIGVGWIAPVFLSIKRSEEALRVLSLVDDLTGLRNRRGFLTLAEQQIKIANRLKKGMFLLFADLDGLKWINDNLGHNEGNLALVVIANILKETFRESDIIARIGGDEFVVLIIEPSDSTDIIDTRLKERLEAYNTRVIRPYKLSLSTGIALYNPEYPCSIDELLARADALMYEQKKGKHISII